MAVGSNLVARLSSFRLILLPTVNPYNAQHVLIRLLKEWRESLDKNYIVGGVLVDVSKAFHCIPSDLLIA